MAPGVDAALKALRALSAEAAPAASAAQYAGALSDARATCESAALRSKSSDGQRGGAAARKEREELASAAVGCLHTLWAPAADAVDAALANGRIETAGVELLAASVKRCMVNPPESAEAVAAAAGTVGDALWALYSVGGVRVQPCLALGRMLNALAALACRNVAVESPEVYERTWQAWCDLAALLGATPALVASCGGAAGKATLLYVLQGMRYAERKLSVGSVSRSCAFWGNLDTLFYEAEATALSPSRRRVKLFPTYALESAVADSNTGGAGEGRRGGGGGVGVPAAHGSQLPKSTPRNVKAGVERGEGHGPRKEFFVLAGADMAKAQPAGCGRRGSGGPCLPALFEHVRSAGYHWPNRSIEQQQRTKELREAYIAAGWLLGQALHNRAQVSLRLPAALCAQLLPGCKQHSTYEPTLKDLEEFDPAAARSIRAAAALPPKEWRAMLELEELPRKLTHEQYVARSVRSVLVRSVAWQVEALRAGFAAAVDAQAMIDMRFSGEELAEALCGASAADVEALDLRKAFRLVVDTQLQGGGASEALGDALWSTVGSWSAPMKRKFLVFVTGSDRLPAPGAELLKVELPFVALGAADLREQMGMLPQAHTCENILELPDYYAGVCKLEGLSGASAARRCREVLEDRLAMAVANCEGYGLDGADE